MQSQSSSRGFKQSSTGETMAQPAISPLLSKKTKWKKQRKKPKLSLAGSPSVAVAPAFPSQPTASALHRFLPRATHSPHAAQERPSRVRARLTRSLGHNGSMDPSGVYPSVHQTSTWPSPLLHRSPVRRGRGGPRGGVRALPATLLLPPSATGPEATVPKRLSRGFRTYQPQPWPRWGPKMGPESKYLPELMAERAPSTCLSLTPCSSLHRN